MSTSTFLQDRTNRLPSIAEDIERELVGPARERVLSELLGPTHCYQLKELLTTAAAALPRPERLLFEVRGWEKAIHHLRSNPGLDAQARQRAAEDVISSYARGDAVQTVLSDRIVNAESQS